MYRDLSSRNVENVGYSAACSISIITWTPKQDSNVQSRLPKGKQTRVATHKSVHWTQTLV